MNVDELETALVNGDLSPYQAETYVTLLELQDAAATEIVDTCTVPQPRIYDVLRELDKKGYVETYEEETLRARAHDPTEVVGDLQSQAQELSAAAETIQEVWERPPIGDHEISVFGSFDSVIDNACAGFRLADYHIQVAASATTFVDLFSALKEAYDSGVFVKLSIYVDRENRRPVEELLEYFDQSATEVRRRETPSPFLALIDSNESYFALQQQQSADSYGMLVKDQALSAMLYWYFQNALWEHWDVIDSDTNGEQVEYVEIRECICDIHPLVEAGETVTLTVSGYDTQTGEECTITGEVFDIVTPETFSVDSSFHDRYTGQVTIMLEANDTRYAVGGLGAVIEDIQAAKIVVNETGR